MLAIAIACYRYRYVLEYVHVCTRVVLEYCNTYSVCHSIPVYSSMSILVYTRVHVYRYRYHGMAIPSGFHGIHGCSIPYGQTVEYSQTIGFNTIVLFFSHTIWFEKKKKKKN